MDVKLSENLRMLRKQRNLTQEQLSEALGVSVGVISKWELGLSTPELSIVLELANFFETSVDALLGYQKLDRQREALLEQIKDYIHNHDAPVPFIQLEQALLKYPYDFDVAYRCATLYSLRGTVSGDRRLLSRALELFEAAARLIEQNTNPDISLTSIHTHIAGVYRSMNRDEDAVELLKQNNPCGVNNSLIAEIIAQRSQNPEEALPYLTHALLDHTDQTMHIAMAYVNVYMHQKKYRETIEVLDWVETLLRAIRRSDEPSYLDKMEIGFLVARSYAHLLLKEPDMAGQILRRAKAQAARFDANPDYSASSLRFVTPVAATAYDDYGQTAMEAISRVIYMQENEAFVALWKEIQDETH